MKNMKNAILVFKYKCQGDVHIALTLVLFWISVFS